MRRKNAIFFLLCNKTTMLHTIFLLAYVTTLAHSYVLLQMSKDDQNRSNVDALIHKVVPADRFEFAKHLARKQLQPINKERSKRNFSSGESGSEGKRQKLTNAAQDSSNTPPVLRAREEFKLEPQRIYFRSKPSLMYELNTSILIKAIKDFLSSNLVATYTDEVAKKAAHVYRAYNAPSS